MWRHRLIQALAGLMPLLLLVIGAVGYYFYTARETAYINGQNLRHLATLSDRISDQLTTYRRVLSNAAKTEHPEAALPSTIPWQVEFTAYKPGVEVENPPQPVTIIVSRLINGEHWFEFQTKGWKGDLRVRLQVEEMVAPLLESNGFDKILLASGNGQVLFQTGRSDLHIITIAGLSIAGGKDLELSNLRRASYLSDVEISDEIYRLFVHPLVVIGKEESFGYPEGAEGWLLCGLVEEGRFRLATLSLPSFWVLLIVVLFCLTVLGMPFLKLFYMGSEERLRAIDGLLLALSTFVTMSLLTILLLDWLAYRGLSQESEGQLRVIARRAREEFHKEVAEACTSLKGYDAEARLLRPWEHPLQKHEPLTPTLDDALSSYAGVDKRGEQLWRWSVGPEELPPFEVAERRYFKDIMRNRLWSFKGCESRMAIETVQSWATGELLTILAAPFEPSPKDRQPLLTAVTWRFPSLSNAVLPPGYGFAILGQDGGVLLHSDLRRSGRENFLEETGQNRELQSRLFSGRPGTLRVRYAGRDHFLYLLPLTDVPLWVVSFREASALEGTNTAILITSMVCLLAYSLVFSILFSAGYLVPSFRARWVWPSEQRRVTYWRLVIFYGIVFALFTWTLRFGEPSPAQLFWMGILVPPIVLLTSYLKVRHGDRQLKFIQGLLAKPSQDTPAPFSERWHWRRLKAAAHRWAEAIVHRLEQGRGVWRDTKMWLVLAIVLTLLAILRSALALEWIGNLVLTAAVAASAVVLFSSSTQSAGDQDGFDTPTLFGPYVCATSILLGVLAVLPASAFFKLAHDYHTVNGVRHTHLSLQHALEQRRQQGDNSPAVFPFLLPRTLVLTPGQPPGRLACSEVRKRNVLGGDPLSIGSAANWELAGLMARLTRVPLYNQTLIEASHLGDEDSTGRWQRHSELEPGLLLFRGDSRNLLCGALSELPSFHLWAAENRGGFALLGLLFLLSLGVMSFVGRELLLLGTGVPVWLKSAVLGRAAVGGNLFLRKIEDLDTVRTSPEVEVIDLINDDPRKSRNLEGKSRVYVVGFDYRLQDRWVNHDKLIVLEKLVGDGDRIVVVESRQDPCRALKEGLLCDPQNEREYKQWEALLQRFKILPRNWRQNSDELRKQLEATETGLEVSLKDVPWHNAVGRRRHGSEILDYIRDECQVSSQLQEIGKSLLKIPNVLTWTRERLLTEIGERAESHYQFLWSSLPRDEKLALGHLADEGLVNPKNRRALQRLILRALVDRDPSIEVMNESFRRFVASRSCQAEVFRIERAAKESAWIRLRRPLLVVLLAAAAFVFVTQREAYDETLLWMTGVAAALPQFIKIVGYLGATKQVDIDET
jgi:hypothetical protein